MSVTSEIMPRMALAYFQEYCLNYKVLLSLFVIIFPNLESDSDSAMPEFA